MARNAIMRSGAVNTKKMLPAKPNTLLALNSRHTQGENKLRKYKLTSGSKRGVTGEMIPLCKQVPHRLCRLEKDKSCPQNKDHADKKPESPFSS